MKAHFVLQSIYVVNFEREKIREKKLKKANKKIKKMKKKEGK